jgi:hypothetical protein
MPPTDPQGLATAARRQQTHFPGNAPRKGFFPYFEPDSGVYAYTALLHRQTRARTRHAGPGGCFCLPADWRRKSIVFDPLPAPVPIPLSSRNDDFCTRKNSFESKPYPSFTSTFDDAAKNPFHRESTT